MQGRQFLRAFIAYGAHKVSASTNPHVLLACMPKSASTFLSTALSNLPGMERVWLAPGGKRVEQEFNLVSLAANSRRGYVAQQHIRFGDHADRQIRRFGITPFYMTRNLFDCVASLRDHTRNETSLNPLAWITEEHAELPDVELEDMIVDLIMPWYIQFLVSWRECHEAVEIPYESVRNDPKSVVQMIASRAGIRATSSDILDAVEKAKSMPTRKNKAISGRGSDISEYAKERILKLIRHYPTVDFTSVVS